jgi:hypothetical protein
VRSTWIKEQQVRAHKGALSQYQVNRMVTFFIED